MSREQPNRGNTFTRGFRRPFGLKPDSGNRHYFRGSRGGQGRGGGPARRFDSPSETNIKDGLDTSKVIETIFPPARPTPPDDVPIGNVNYVASYNWVNTEKPTIVVPGSPAVWVGRDVPFTLQPDDGSHFVDQNSARMSEYPMLPLFVAADIIHDKKKAPVDWPTVDIVTDRNGLRKLLRWLNPSAGREVRDFRIDVELVGTKTVLLSRWEGQTRDPPSGRSFGFAFEAAMTRAAPGCPTSGHHRAITYDMLDMKMVVRFEVDACLPTDASTATTATNIDTKRPEKKTVASVDDLADALEGINLVTSSTPAITTTTTTTTTSSSSSSSSSSDINIIHAGTPVPQDALLELASRSAYFLDQLDWNELYPQLTLAQTPGFRLGVHERGTFTQLREWQLGGSGLRSRSGTGTSSNSGSGPSDLTAQRQETAAQIVRLARVLEDIQELAIARGPGPAGSFSLLCENGEMRVYGRKDGKSCLPPDVTSRFEAGAAEVD
ncbi:hypothetical protein B0F90DRAFT_1644649 [Multifurca ochricompacta]|uniref:Uncharacterized protein n=1 Tax=Multifurca ochricompacta TaxID=376703 RepID=A0AAD4LW77_9AGAM|nr:hypothetical protein B0F90DRAFT_1644649 [Multifurca ochricompacta]